MRYDYVVQNTSDIIIAYKTIYVCQIDIIIISTILVIRSSFNVDFTLYG